MERGWSLKFLVGAFGVLVNTLELFLVSIGLGWRLEFSFSKTEIDLVEASS